MITAGEIPYETVFDVNVKLNYIYESQINS